MATTTATIFIGTAHPNHSGIIPTHYIQLTENSRPALLLRSIDGNDKPITVIPTLEDMVKDIYLMVAVFVTKNVILVNEINTPKKESMYDLFTDAERKALYKQACLSTKGINLKMAFNILEHSHLNSKLEEIKSLPHDIEITAPIFKKEFNRWADKVVINEF